MNKQELIKIRQMLVDDHKKRISEYIKGSASFNLEQSEYIANTIRKFKKELDIFDLKIEIAELREELDKQTKRIDKEISDNFENHNEFREYMYSGDRYPVKYPDDPTYQ